MSMVQALHVLNQAWSRRGATASAAAAVAATSALDLFATSAVAARASTGRAALVSPKQQHRMMRQGQSNQQYPYTTSTRKYPYSASQSSNGCSSLASMISTTAVAQRHMSSWMFAAAAGPRLLPIPTHQHHQHASKQEHQQPVQPLVYLEWKKGLGPCRWESSMAATTMATSTLSNSKNADQSSGRSSSSSSTGGSSNSSTNTNTTNATNTNSNVFLDNMGTIFLTAICGIVAWLVRSYLNSQAQTHVRLRLEATAVVDPIELHDVQVANRNAIMAVSSSSGSSNSNTVEPVLSPALFLQLVQTVRDKQQHLASNGGDGGTGTRMTYPDFVAAVRAAWPDAIAAVTASGSTDKATSIGTLEMGHILDRIALSLVMKHQESSPLALSISNSDSSNTTAAACTSLDDGRRQYSTTEQHLLQTTALPIQQWWTLVSLALPSSFETDANGSSGSDNGKIRSLYQMMQLLKDMLHEQGESNDPAEIATLLTIDDVIELVQYLQDSFQLAPDAQIVMDPDQQIAFPLQAYTVGTPEQLVRIAHVAINSNSTNSTSKDDTPSTTTLNTADVATKHAATDRIDVDTCAAILTSRSVCAWGECYRKTKRR